MHFIRFCRCAHCFQTKYIYQNLLQQEKIMNTKKTLSLLLAVGITVSAAYAVPVIPGVDQSICSIRLKVYADIRILSHFDIIPLSELLHDSIFDKALDLVHIDHIS